MTVDEIIDRVIAIERSTFTHDTEAGDPPTKYGITPIALKAYRRLTLGWTLAKSVVTVDDIKAITRSVAVKIYRAEYIDRPGFGQLPEGLTRVQVIDWGVIAGQRTAARGLQHAIGILLQRALTVDGLVGPITLAAAKECRDWPLVHQLSLLRSAYCVDVVRRSVKKFCEAHDVPDATQKTKLKYSKGWQRRNLEVLR
jgi:lysozyme family protein